MKVNSNRDISFKSIYTNKALKKGLEFAAQDGAMFSATTILALSMLARPAAIALAPHTDKENKKLPVQSRLHQVLRDICLPCLFRHRLLTR